MVFISFPYLGRRFKVDDINLVLCPRIEPWNYDIAPA